MSLLPYGPDWGSIVPDSSIRVWYTDAAGVVRNLSELAGASLESSTVGIPYWPEYKEPDLANRWVPLPGPVDQSYAAERQDVLLRASMDAGPGKTRRRFSAQSVYVQAKWLFTHRQLLVFDGWYVGPLVQGSLPFHWPLPWTRPTPSVGATFTNSYTFVRTRFKKLNAYKQIGGTLVPYTADNTNLLHTVWDVTAELEVLP